MKILTKKDIMFMVDKMADIAIDNEIAFCELDSAAGDGDFGMSLAKGFRQLKVQWAQMDCTDIGTFLRAVSMIIMEYCGGASGPIWGSAFRAAAKQAGAVQELDLQGFADIMQAAVVGIQKTGERSFGRGAVVGDKTLIDALVPAANSLTDSAAKHEDFYQALANSARAAVEGAENTRNLVAKMGRAENVGTRSLSHPDAGAFGLGIIFSQVVQALGIYWNK